MVDPDSSGMRERILDKATDLFVAQGYNGISMREIAAACGLSKAGLYYHFKDKEDLFLAILNESLNLLEAIIDEVQARGESPTETLRRFIGAIFTRLPPGRRAVIRLASQEMDKISPAARADFYRRYQERFVGRIQRILDAGVRAGELRAMDTGMGAWSLLGLMYPFMSAEAAGSMEPVAEFLAALFLDGARAR